MESAVDPAPPEVTESHSGKRYFLIAAVAMFVWLTALLAMVAFTANPVTVNRRQLKNSHYVVTATIKDLKTGQVDVLKEWKGGEGRKEINVTGLAGKVVVAGAGKPVDGKTYVLPLSMTPDGLRVTPINAKEDSATIYPAEEGTLEQVEEALSN